MFWEVYDSHQGNILSAIGKNEYLSKGSQVLRDYNAQKNIVANLPQLLDQNAYRAYSESVRPYTENLNAIAVVNEEGYDELILKYPDTKIADVYFLIGAMSAGGRISNRGLLIGTEMFSKSKITDKSTLSSLWELTTSIK